MQFETRYLGRYGRPVEQQDNLTGVLQVCWCLFIQVLTADTSQASESSENIFDALLTYSDPHLDVSDNELERYLKEPREAVMNIVQWWIDNSKRYPCLSRMALDYHTIPGALLSYI